MDRTIHVLSGMSTLTERTIHVLSGMPILHLAGRPGGDSHDFSQFLRHAKRTQVEQHAVNLFLRLDFRWDGFVTPYALKRALQKSKVYVPSELLISELGI